MRYVVSPGEGVGSIRFGMTREDVHARLGAPDDEGVWEDAHELEDEWEDDGIAVRFDPSGACVEIALYPPATARLRGACLLGEHDGDWKATLLGLDPDCVAEDAVIVSESLGVLYTVDDEGTPELVVLAPGRLDALAEGVDDDAETDDDGDGEENEDDSGGPPRE